MVTFATNYDIPFKHRKHFTQEEQFSLINAFKNYDKDKSGSIERNEFKLVIKETGHIEADE